MPFTPEQKKAWRERPDVQARQREHKQKWQAANRRPKKPRKLLTAEEKRAAKRAEYQRHKADYAERNAEWYADPANRKRHLRRRRDNYRENLEREHARQRGRWRLRKQKRKGVEQ